MAAMYQLYSCIVFSGKTCKYFDEGKGTCPFGDSCLYRHGKLVKCSFYSFLLLSLSLSAFPDGTLSKSAPRLTYDSDGLTKPVGTAT